MTFIEARLGICGGCEFNLENTCALCGCDIIQKTADPNESCPTTPKKWVALTAQPKKTGEQTTTVASPPACIPCKHKTR